MNFSYLNWKTLLNNYPKAHKKPAAINVIKPDLYSVCVTIGARQFGQFVFTEYSPKNWLVFGIIICWVTFD
jgi:hypothetical protein